MVLNDLPRADVSDIIVVDNGSQDDTSRVAGRLGCRVVSEPRRGYGQACLSGMSELRDDTDIVVFLDADYSDHPDQLPALLSLIMDDGYDFVLGSRILGQREEGAMMPQAYYGNKLACGLMTMFWGFRYTDLGPFRAIRYPALKRLGMTDRNFGWTIEMQIKAVEQGLRIKEVPVDYRCRVGRSKISGTFKGTVLAGSKILWTIFLYRCLPREQS